MTSDLTSVTLITLVFMCILPPTASEAKAKAKAKRPQRSHLTSKFNSVTPITYVPMLIWPLNASSDSISPGEEGGGLSSIDLRGFAAGKNSVPAAAGAVATSHTVFSAQHSTALVRK